MPPSGSETAKPQRRILDYSDYVEMACEEADAAYGSFPSRRDVARGAARFLDPKERPIDPFAVPYSYQGRVIGRWQDYLSSRHELFGKWHHYDNCPHCASTLELLSVPVDTATLRGIATRLCPTCGWWDTEEALPVVRETSGSYSARSVHRRAVLREFSVAGSDAPIESLRKHILCHPTDLAQMNPRKLEDLVGHVFGEFMACEAIHVGGPGDGGIDLVLLEGDCRYVVQVKRRASPESAESVKGVREFVGAMVLDGTLRGLYISTASHFSRQAIEATETAVQRQVVEFLALADAERLIDVCRLTAARAEPTWKTALIADPRTLETADEGFIEFMAVAMGHPDWTIDTSGIRR